MQFINTNDRERLKAKADYLFKHNRVDKTKTLHQFMEINKNENFVCRIHNRQLIYIGDVIKYNMMLS